MEFLPKEPYKKVFCIVFYAVLIFIFLFVFFKYAVPVLLPFIISFGIAYAVRRPAEFLHEKTGTSKGVISVFLGLSLLFCCAGILYICVSKLIGELSSFAQSLIEQREDILSYTAGLSEKINVFLEKILPGSNAQTQNIREKLSTLITDGIKNIVSTISTKIPAFVGNIFTMLPKILFFLGATVLSCFYFCVDLDNMYRFLRTHLTKKPLALVCKLKNASFSAVGRYIRASLIIFLLTSAILSAGFLFIGIRYALLLAAVTAFIDILPVFGSGIILVPYAIYGFLSGNISLGAGMTVLYVVVTLARQFAEPRIMGKSLGMHPIVSLAAVYAGYNFIGVIGMIFLPICVVVVKNIIYAKNAQPKAVRG